LRSAAIGAVASGVVAAYGREELKDLQYAKVSLLLPNWNRNGFTVGFLSDSHLTEELAANVTRDAVDWLIKQKPDVILYGGDFVEDTREGTKRYMPMAFEQIKNCGIPCITVLGNHDYGTADPETVIRTATQLGFQVLRNQLTFAGGITIVGLDCLSFGYCQPEFLTAQPSSENTICMVHEPDAVLQMAPQTASLVLAGHSHGGQICLPGGIPIHTPLYAKKYKVGYYPNAPNPLYVSRGLGATGLRVRTFCRPEVTLFRLDSNVLL